MSASFRASPAELDLVNQIFSKADKPKQGILKGDVAVEVFNGAKLAGSVLGEIWSIADEENNGWLSKTGTAKALRLIGHAQKGSKVSPTLLTKSGPLAVIEGYTSIPQQDTGASIPKSPPPGFPPLSPQDKIKFQNIFNRSGPTNGLLNGDKARDIFLKSQLSNDKLSQVWSLADTRDRGALDITDFTIAMYFIQGLMMQQISFVPTTLPPGLYEQAGGLSTTTSPSQSAHFSGSSGSLSPVGSNFSRLQPQYTGQSSPLAPDHASPSQFGAPSLPSRPSQAPFKPTSVVQTGRDAWDVSPSEKADADAIFSGELDKQNVGFIEGETAVPFMLKSQLPSEVLAQIWDLADINGDGRLTRDGFAIAFHLIRKRLAGQPLPAQLPPSLIPPSLRKQATVFQVSQPEPPRDLLDLDDTPPASAISPQATGAMSPQITGTMSVLQPQSTGATAVPPIPPRNTIKDPFASSSPFGPTNPPSDLMEEHEDHPNTTSVSIHDQGAELGNVRNELQSTNRALESTKVERAKLESTVASQAAELIALQTQSSSAKAAYETEVALLSQLKERSAVQSAEIQRNRVELIRSESDLSAIRVEKAEIEQAFLRDKEEVRDLHKRMIDAGQQAEQLKGEVEKLKKEAKQQKGRLAIARKQLATKEAEKIKVEKEVEEANVEVQSAIKETGEVEDQIAQFDEEPHSARVLSQDTVDRAVGQPLPASPEPVSTTKSNNPFERLAMSGPSSPQSQLPFIPFGSSGLTVPVEDQNDQTKSESQSKLDNFFGVEEVEPAPVQEQVSKPDAQIHDDSVLKDMDIPPASPTTSTSTEHFVTPSTTANYDPPPESSDNLADAANARFPDLVVDSPSSSSLLGDVALAGSEKKGPEQPMTDLDTRLEELEVNESDSDESDDDDDAPLAEVAQKAKDRVTSPVAKDEAGETIPSPIVTDSQDQIKSSFDDIFGSSDMSDASAQAHDGALSPEGSKPSSSPFDHPIATESPTSSKPTDIAGVNAFDEALGSFSSPPSATPAQFTFEGFEDSFDFGAAGGTQVSSLPQPATTVDSSISTQTQVPSSAPQMVTSPVQSTFDDIFATSSTAPAAATQQRTASTPIPNGSEARPEAAKSTSFDDAFASFDTNPNLSFEPSYITSSKEPEPHTPSSSKLFPTSPRGLDASSPRSSVNRTSSPGPRPSSPSGRMTSPVPRKSTSSKESHEKLKESGTKHSRLNMLFSFKQKKKNKNQETLAPPATPISSSSSPPPAPADGSGIKTSAPDDDEAVVQILGMGFEREQAVQALEKTGYNVPLAINSLLQ